MQSRTPTVFAASANGHRSLSDMFRMARALSRAKLDLLLFPTIYSYVPVVSRAKKIVMIHDVIAERYPALTMPGRRARLFWKTKVALGRWQADAIATVSDYSRRGLVEYFGMDAERVYVIGEASDPVFRLLDEARLTPRLKSLGLSNNQRAIVYVGGFSPHKNLEMLVAGFAKLAPQSSFSDVVLVLVGEHEREVFHSYAATIKKQIQKFGLAERVIFTGYLPDNELVVLLNLAAVSVLPSLIEGFGLPAVEAAACGCPVIATTESPLPALLGEGGLYFDPTRPQELENALIRVLEAGTQRRRMGEAARKAASRLTWEAAAQQMVSLIRKVASS
ncbi:MAG TPA: glycosyltransferase family 1 protein [Pyrinomonadaceae bacterium]|nr:glycosyltransferase family 1 protein [Pyrinomonadaceae bacterium]